MRFVFGIAGVAMMVACAIAGVAMVTAGASMRGAAAEPNPRSSNFDSARIHMAQRIGGLRESAGKRMSDPDYEDILGRPNNGPAVGEMAPDFDLMPLKFYEFGIDTEDITVDNAGELYKPVRLSDFRGNKPVVLIFGSYT